MAESGCPGEKEKGASLTLPGGRQVKVAERDSQKKRIRVSQQGKSRQGDITLQYRKTRFKKPGLQVVGGIASQLLREVRN